MATGVPRRVKILGELPAVAQVEAAVRLQLSERRASRRPPRGLWHSLRNQCKRVIFHWPSALRCTLPVFAYVTLIHFGITLLPSSNRSGSVCVLVQTGIPTSSPTSWMPSPAPTHVPSYFPSVSPTMNPTATPTGTPSFVPSDNPTVGPTRKVWPCRNQRCLVSRCVRARFQSMAIPAFFFAPSAIRSLAQGTPVPTELPTLAGTTTPTLSPTLGPTAPPTAIPSRVPTPNVCLASLASLAVRGTVHAQASTAYARW